MTRKQIGTLLIVCAGNICRSPMAEAMFRHRLKDRPTLAHIDVRSAGTIAYEGNPPSADAVEILRETFDLNIAPHRARPFTRRMEADLILTVDRWTTETVTQLALKGQLEMLGDFVGTGEEVEDPYGGSKAGYRRSIRQLDRLVDLAIDKLETNARDNS